MNLSLSLSGKALTGKTLSYPALGSQLGLTVTGLLIRLLLSVRRIGLLSELGSEGGSQMGQYRVENWV